MPPRLELGGRRFGRLVAIERSQQDDHGAWMWRCRCDCGTVVTVRAATLQAGRTRACHPCAATDRAATHGMTGTPLYRRWRAMLARTGNPKHADFHNYGGRGITVCERWRSSFESFAADMGPTFSPNLELDRIDVDGDYEPANCRWISHAAQQRNKRTNRVLTFAGRSQSVAEWADELGVKANTIQSRLRRGWPIERVLLELANGGSS